MNVIAKYANKEIGMQELLNEMNFVANECKGISIDALNKVMDRFQNISEELLEEIMCYTRISGTKNGKKAIAYALGNGHGHNSNPYRNLVVGSVGLLPEEFGSYCDQMEAIWAQKLSANNLNQIRRVIVSFSQNELSKDNPEDVELAMTMCQEFVKEAYDGHDALICLSADGKGSKLHAHILVNNVSSKDFKGCTREQGHFSYVMREWNKVQRRYIQIDLGKGSKDKMSQNERRMREENEKAEANGFAAPNYIWKDDLKNRIRIAMNKAVSRQSFLDILEELGVSAKFRKKGKPGEYIAYELFDIPSQYEEIRGSLKARSHTLGTDYDVEMLDKKIEENTSHIQHLSNSKTSFDENNHFESETPVSTKKDLPSDSQDGNTSSDSNITGASSSTNEDGITIDDVNSVTNKTKVSKPMTAFERLKYEVEKMDKAEHERHLENKSSYDYSY